MAQNNKKQDQDFQDELDVLQTVWVLGKQRGEKKPLSSDDLNKLLKSNRLSVELLSDEEKNFLDVSGSEESGDLKTQKDQIINGVVGNLLRQVAVQFKETIGEKEWDKLDTRDKDNGTRLMFYTYYGKSPEIYKEELLRVLK